MKSAHHHLGWIDEAVVQSWNRTGPEPPRPVLLFQFAAETRLAGGNPVEREEAILDVTRHEGTVSQIFVLLSPGVQPARQPPDHVGAMGHEELENIDVFLKRHVTTVS